MSGDLQRSLKYVYANYCHVEKGFSNIETLKLIPTLLAHYADKDTPDSIINDGNILKSFLVKIELIERIVQGQKIPKEFKCVFRNENDESQIPQNFSFSPQIHMSEYPAHIINKNMIDEIQTELSNIDIFGMLIYIKEKATIAGDFMDAMK